MRTQPIAAWRLAIAGNNFHLVRRAQRIIQRHYAAIDLSAFAANAYIRMDTKGKIDRRGIFRQIHHMPFGVNT